MFAGWNLVLTLLIVSFVGQSHGFWPFTVSATTDAPDTVYADAGAKRIATVCLAKINEMKLLDFQWGTGVN